MKRCWTRTPKDDNLLLRNDKALELLGDVLSSGVGA